MLISVRQIRSAKSAVSACESFLALINTFIFPVKSSDNNSSHVQSFKWGELGHTDGEDDSRFLHRDNRWKPAAVPRDDPCSIIEGLDEDAC